MPPLFGEIVSEDQIVLCEAESIWQQQQQGSGRLGAPFGDIYIGWQCPDRRKSSQWGV